jgi:hypothetical protein
VTNFRRGTSFIFSTTKNATFRLFALRKRLWQTASAREPVDEVWLQAKELMPNWPGFRRLVLSREEQMALKDCEDETGEMVDDFRRTSSVFSVTDEGDGPSAL